MTRRRRYLWLMAAVLLLLAPAAVGWLLVSTEWGLHQTWSFLERRLPDGVTVEGVHGRLRSPLSVDGIVVRGEAATVEVGRVVVDWSLRPLLRRSLAVRSVQVDDVHVALHSNETPDGRPPDPLRDLSLPLSAFVQHTVVREVSIASATEGAREVRVDSIEIRDLSLQERFDVASLTAQGPDGSIAVLGWLDPRGEYPLSLEVELGGPLPELPAARGRIVVTGSLSQLSMTAVAFEPFQAELIATVESLRDRPRFSAEVTFPEFDARSLRSDWPEIRAQGTVTASGTRDSIRAVTAARIEMPETGLLVLDGAVRQLGDTLFIERLGATAKGMRMRATGTVALGGPEPEANLTIHGAALRWPLDSPPRVRVDTGWVSVDGTLGGYRISGGARGAPVDGPRARAWLAGTGTRERLDLSDLRVDVPGGSVRARGTVGWAPRPTWDLTALVNDMDPSALLPDSGVWEGRLSLRGRTRGTILERGAEGTLSVQELSGLLRERSVAGRARAGFYLPARAPGAGPVLPYVSLDTLELEWGPNSIQARGTVADSLDVDLRLSAPDLGAVLPDAQGQLEVGGTLSGSRRTPGVEATVSGLGLGHRGRTVEDLTLSVHVDSESGGVVDVRGVARNVVAEGTRLDSLSLMVTGTTDDHGLTSRLSGSRGALDVAARGAVRDRAWRGSVQRFDFDLEPLGSWMLADSVQLSFSQTGSELENGCWRSEGASVCVAATWEAQGPSTLEASVRDVGLERFKPSMPDDWALTGALNGEARVRVGADRALSVEGRADLGSGRIDYPGSGGVRSLHYSEARLEVTTDEDGSRGSLGLRLTDELATAVASVTGHAALPDYTALDQPLADQSLTGQVQASVTDFSALEAMIARVEALTGELSVDVSVSGTVGAPELQGEAHLRAGAADVQRLGLQVRDVELTAVGLGREGVALEGTARSGAGSIRIEGVVPTLPSATDSARLQIVGERFQVLEVPEASVWVSPELALTATRGRIDLTGRVDIPRARVELSEVSSAGVSPSRDVVFVGDSTAAASREPDIHSRVRITLGDSVTFRGFGLTAEPTGSVLATDAPGRATTAAGEITLNRGRYRAYGQELAVERGRIVYAGGPLDNPGLDVRASRRARDGVVAGLDIRGTARNPEVTIFSQPVMTQSEALAYVILGRPLSGASYSEGSRVAGAAASLGIRGGNVLAGRIAQRLGLEEVRIEAEGPLEAASLVAGTYLSPRLYVSYGVGLFEPISTFRMRYTLSRLWTFQAETGRATGADLMYRIESGRF